MWQDEDLLGRTQTLPMNRPLSLNLWLFTICHRPLPSGSWSQFISVFRKKPLPMNRRINEWEGEAVPNPDFMSFWFMGREQVRKEQGAPHEPILIR